MKTDTAPAVDHITRLADYCPPAFTIKTVSLDFNLYPTKTKVVSTLQVSRRVQDVDWVLDGENIKLNKITLNGKRLAKKKYTLTETNLTLSNLPDEFELQIETVCNPQQNKALMGLYVSGGRFCTQCEAEGFRRITYFPDRPDVLSVYTVRIQADKKTYPTLLSNGNCLEQGDLTDGRHFAVWHDPFPKPSYLFALVGGNFDTIHDTFTTMSGRVIDLDIYVDTGSKNRAHYAMDALKRSMKWDEDAFGREYDLDRFMIVAVRDFNFGAMENKGLNIFNSSLLLADEASATDMNFELIESVIGHEYFHNWTGNRITCRDWFQLCLKEGFTVFRDQEFSATQRGAGLQRIKDVKALRARQFPEDAGPLSHAVRPQSYMKIDNFYTATIYEKGAELIRMLRELLAPKDFHKGCDAYFDTLDGTAATIEEFINCFETATGQDLSHFMHWYNQAGTPDVHIKTHFNESAKTYQIKLSQNTKPTAGQPDKQALPMPVKFGLIDKNGRNFAQQTVVFDTEHTKIQVENVSEEPVLSAFRGFSAPINIHMDKPSSHAVLQMRADEDLFNRWEAGQALGRTVLTQYTNAIQRGEMPVTHLQSDAAAYISALAHIASDDDMDTGFKALALSLPSEGEILQNCTNIARTNNIEAQTDPLAILQARQLMLQALADRSHADLLKNYEACSAPIKFVPDAHGAGRRSLRNMSLSLLSHSDPSGAQKLAEQQFSTATNMSEEIGALAVLVRLGDQVTGNIAEQALSQFYDKWKNTPLVIDKWFSIHALRSGKNALSDIKNLTQHSDFKGSNPNRVRALIGGFSMANASSFHKINGSGYQFFADQISQIDKQNPQLAARLLGAFGIWRQLDTARQNMIRDHLKFIIANKPSQNVLEIATKSLGD